MNRKVRRRSDRVWRAVLGARGPSGARVSGARVFSTMAGFLARSTCSGGGDLFGGRPQASAESVPRPNGPSRPRSFTPRGVRRGFDRDARCPSGRRGERESAGGGHTTTRRSSESGVREVTWGSRDRRRSERPPGEIKPEHLIKPGVMHHAIIRAYGSFDPSARGGSFRGMMFWQSSIEAGGGCSHLRRWH